MEVQTHDIVATFVDMDLHCNIDHISTFSSHSSISLVGTYANDPAYGAQVSPLERPAMEGFTLD